MCVCVYLSSLAFQFPQTDKPYLGSVAFHTLFQEASLQGYPSCTLLLLLAALSFFHAEVLLFDSRFINIEIVCQILLNDASFSKQSVQRTTTCRTQTPALPLYLSMSSFLCVRVFSVLLSIFCNKRQISVCNAVKKFSFSNILNSLHRVGQKRTPAPRCSCKMPPIMMLLCVTSPFCFKTHLFNSYATFQIIHGVAWHNRIFIPNLVIYRVACLLLLLAFVTSISLCVCLGVCIA